MRNKIAKSIKLSAFGLTFLFAMGSAQAAPLLDHDFGLLTPGTKSQSLSLPDDDPNVRWFGFALDATSFVDLNTVNSNADTELGLYDNTGLLLGDNDDCDAIVLTSCLTFSSLDAGDYFAAVINFNGIFDDIDFAVTTFELGSPLVTLNVTARALNPVPVPATIWLFGTALLGFVGMSRRTSIKS